MTSLRRLSLWTAPPVLLLAGAAAIAQSADFVGPAPVDASETRRKLAEARAQGESARARAEKLEGEARRVNETAEKTAREAAAVAARIQETEATIAAQEARIALIGRERAKLRERLAERQQPLVRLTGALQRLSRRPPVLAMLRPGSVRDTMYMRALLETMMPEVEKRTSALRSEIEKGEALERQALAARERLAASESRLEERRSALAALESQQRLASRQVGGTAAREAERALALAERARDLTDLVEEFGKAGQLREELARLPGPIMRPPRPEESRVVAAESFTAPPAGLPDYVLPVSGRVVAGFGEANEGDVRSRGISLSTRPGAQAVAPAPGRVAFAGPYQGYGQIVIIEHGGGWTSVVTGLAQLDTTVGRSLVAGSPLGIAGAGDPVVGLELRRDGEAVNPLQYVRTL
ncbi:hypothetical protein GCM10011371_15750 [Novosphingobium marinum]|uniref:Septal ring factor EnvC (AmiA/AmiB activator) n=1 Tax=Novosphingobium marinum TaxID=1514948 RepID=A0A7Z0BU02_9SPHN|nr:peptidoglycan DD-metalloendopeptidase family protein [Novosphingobium marinum]NYH95689.1 septal ring factor EnvC (AmiA/AmiB activator) [Novosphingobium marinum]GGC29049.1 hypothetical protein GCM10011371_15750 [Novosphingobium marinum]